MDIINDTNNKTDTKHAGHHKGKSIKVKKVEGKKPVPGGVSFDKAPDTRGRAKSTLANPFDSKKPMNSKKESKPVETIGNDRFNLLKSMFEKKGPSATAEVTTAKYEPKNFGFFQQKNNNETTEEKKSEVAAVQPTGISDGIKKRMQDLMNSNKRSSGQAKIDPILEQRKKEREIENGDDEDEEEEEEEDEKNLGISEEEDNLDKEDEFSESEEEKEKEEEKINHKEQEKDDSFEEQKEDKEDVKEVEIEVNEIKKDNATEEKNDIKSDNEQHAATKDIIEEERKEEIEHAENKSEEVEHAENKSEEVEHVENKLDEVEHSRQQEVPHVTQHIVKEERQEELNHNKIKNHGEYEEEHN